MMTARRTPPRRPLLSAHDRRRVSVLACVEPQTVNRYLAGLARSTTSARIEQALREMGREDLIIRVADDLATGVPRG